MSNLLDKIRKTSFSKPARDPIAEKPAEQQQLFILSAESEPALQDMAARYATFLRDSDATEQILLGDLCYSSAQHNAQHAHRLAVVTATKEDLAHQLAVFAAGAPERGTTSGQVNAKPHLTFVCTGMGPQWWAMGRQLLETEPVFRKTAEEIDHYFRQLSGWSILEEMLRSERASRIAEFEVGFPANFVMQASLAALFMSWGILPDGIVGHSAGEAASAFLSGALSLEDATTLSYHWGRLQHRTSGQGQLVAVGVDEETVKERLRGYEDRVAIAAINGPGSLTLTGETEALQELVGPWQEQGAFVRFMRVHVHAHSHFMEPLQEELMASLQGLSPKEADIPFYSTVTSKQESGLTLDADYWWQNIRKPVLFRSTAEEMLKDGYDVFLELSPHPVLNAAIKDILEHTGKTGAVLTSLRRQTDERLTTLGTLGQLYIMGYDVNWSVLYPSARIVELPSND